MQAGRDYSEIFTVLRGKRPHQPKIQYPVKLYFKSKGGIKTYSEKQKLREFVASTPDL